MIELKLDYPPSVNHLYATVHNRRVLSKEGRAYKKHVWITLLLNRAVKFDHEAKLRLTLAAHPPDARRRDLSNLFKIVEDALQDSGCIPNDCQIKQIYASMEVVNRLDPHIKVRVEVIDE